MKIAVIGGGSWGTAIAGLLGSKGYATHMWARRSQVVTSINESHHNCDYLPTVDLPLSVVASTNLSECAAGADAVILATPSVALRDISLQLASYVAADTPVCVLTKGIESQTGYLMTDIVGEILGNPQRIAGLSGPNHAEEVALHLPAAAVVASYDHRVAQTFQKIFSTDYFRVYYSEDVVGVEVCAAAKNVVAIAVGVAAAAGYGDNTAAVLMTRGLAEMSRLVYALGGQPHTCMGLAGMGDLIATCTSPNSRNRTFGEAFVKGESLEAYQTRRHMVVEGARACQSLKELALKHQVELPITDAVYDLLYNNIELDQIKERLFARLATDEFYGLSDVMTF